MKLSFHGGVQGVTGACYLLETGTAKLLIDCGMFQGSREASEQNFVSFDFDPSRINALFVTHAHIDHVGRIPKLVRAGFRGPIYSTMPTRGLARLLLDDALHLAERADDQLYSHDDLERTLDHWETLAYHQEIVLSDVRVRLRNAGHILGSAFIDIRAEGKRLLFTGDLGNTPSVLLPPPEPADGADYLVMESTYGNRTHEPYAERVLQLERTIEDIATRRGTLMIPAFATERTQDLLYLLNEMVHFKRVPEMPVFVDSPLAIRITDVYESCTDYYNADVQELYRQHPSLFKFKKLVLTETVEQSKHIDEVSVPKVVIAGSGMMTGGRILHHARRHLPDARSTLLVVGYQSRGSLGRRLIDGEKTVKIMGEEVPVAARIEKINGFSAHADNPQLFAFVEAARDSLKRVFVVQGEEEQAAHLASEIRDRLGVDAMVPGLHDIVEL